MVSLPPASFASTRNRKQLTMAVFKVAKSHCETYANRSDKVSVGSTRTLDFLRSFCFESLRTLNIANRPHTQFQSDTQTIMYQLKTPGVVTSVGLVVLGTTLLGFLASVLGQDLLNGEEMIEKARMVAAIHQDPELIMIKELTHPDQAGLWDVYEIVNFFEKLPKKQLTKPFRCDSLPTRCEKTFNATYRGEKETVTFTAYFYIDNFIPVISVAFGIGSEIILEEMDVYGSRSCRRYRGLYSQELGRICAEMDSLEWTQRGLQSCVRLDGKILGVKLLSVKIGCFPVIRGDVNTISRRGKSYSWTNFVRNFMNS